MIKDISRGGILFIKSGSSAVSHSWVFHKIAHDYAVEPQRYKTITAKRGFGLLARATKPSETRGVQ